MPWQPKHSALWCNSPHTTRTCDVLCVRTKEQAHQPHGVMWGAGLAPTKWGERRCWLAVSQGR